MRTPTRTVTAVAAIAIGMTGLTGAAFATGGVNLGGDDLREPGTITVNESTLPENDTAEQAALADLATVTEDAAKAAAVEAVGSGQAERAELEDEDGFVVWDVRVRASDGTIEEVTVDAGDARILGIECDHDDDNDDDD